MNVLTFLTFSSQGVHQANLWQGDFPTENSKEDGWHTTAPVTSYGPNQVGLYNLIGKNYILMLVVPLKFFVSHTFF